MSINLNKNEESFNIFTSDKRESATDIVIETIKKLLVTKKLHPGDKLPSETILSQNLGVSRGSVREAMKILSAFGIVNIKQGDGTYIADTTNDVLFDPLLFKLIVNHRDIRELKELREMIELGIIDLAIKYADEKDIKKLEYSYEYSLEKIHLGLYKDDVIAECELLFHTALGQATKNIMVQTIYNFIMDIFIPNIYRENESINFGEDALRSHRPIIDSIINKDLAAGIKAIKNSVDIWKYNSSI